MKDPKLFLTAALSSILLLSSLQGLVDSGGINKGISGSSSSRRRRSSGLEVEWQILTKRNFSSQIRLHPHILLMVTVPWSGESRSLMKEVANLVVNKQEKLGHLGLMVVFRSSEKMLAEILGATEGITLFYYHHSTSYKYQGRLRAQNILSSVYHLMSLQSEEIPLKHLHTQEDLENFFRSTDKCILLLEFCGWSTKLLGKRNNRSRETSQLARDMSENAGILVENLTRDVDGTLSFDRKKSQKGLENEELTCGVENGLSDSSWLERFTWVNESDLSEGTENKSAGTRMSCTMEEFHRFDSFFSKFITIAREYLLPPERQRFGLISERSLLPSLGVGNPETWLLTLQFAGCPNCSMMLQEGDDLRTLLQMHHPLVMELDVDGRNLEPAFPANRPSIILFVDRSSDSSKIRGESKSTLEVLRKFVQENQLSYQMVRGQHSNDSEGSSAKGFLGTRSISISGSSGHLRSKVSPASQIVKIKDKLAFMVINEGESISFSNMATDIQGNPAYDILAHLLHQRNPALKNKETKISVLAKEAGFQLLSDDFKVKVIDSLPSHKENDQSNDMIESTSMSPSALTSQLPKVSVEHNVNVNVGDLLDALGITEVEDGKQPAHEDMEANVQQNLEAITYSKSTTKISATALSKQVKDELGDSNSAQVNEDDKSCNQEEFGSFTCHAENSFHLEQESPIVEGYTEKDHAHRADYSLKKTCSCGDAQNTECDCFRVSLDGDDAAKAENAVTVGGLGEHVQHQAFMGSYFFSDGGYQLLGTLTADSEIPSLVILDPVLQQHYIFSGEKDFSYSSLVSFVDKFLNGSLTPYRRSESSVASSREFPQPPFVNLDFHETDSIPRLTANTFCELVVGFKHCEGGNEVPYANTQDFGSAWKRDVLVLFSNSWCGFCQRMELIVREVYRAFKSFMNMSKRRDSLSIEDSSEDTMLEGLPSIFLMDCKLNDCGSFLKPMSKSERYPALILFPAEMKDPLSYEGDMSVINIIEFIVSHGSNSQHLGRHKGYLWTHAKQGSKSRDTLHDASSLSVLEQAPYPEDEYSEFVFGAPVKGDNHLHAASHTSENFHDEGQHVVAGSVLAATNKLLNVFPFDNSTILIVTADQNQGFQGLIINKRIKWDVFKDLEELEPLKQAPLFYGGPVRVQSFPLVCLARKAIEGYLEVPAGLYFGNPFATSLAIEGIKSGNLSATDYWFFLGYSSWGWNQLFDELAEGAWQVTNSPEGNIDWPDS